jgi:Leucine-rich repeat (LRR) protein
LTSDVLQRHIGTTSLATVTYLNLHGNAIRKIEGLAVLPALRTLLLSFNELQKMEGLSDLNMLERLDLSYNSIRRIEGLKGVASLRVLELNNNLLHRLDDVNVLKKYVPNLETVDLSSNPICSHKTYRTLLLRRLSAMTSLDGEEVTREDREAASDNTSTLTIQVIKENSFSRRSTSTAVAGISAADQGADDDTWWRHVEELVVEHKRYGGALCTKQTVGVMVG